jgi:hypothetical protein
MPKILPTTITIMIMMIMVVVEEDVLGDNAPFS